MTFTSYFIRSSVRITKPPIQVYKGFKRKFYIKGHVVRGLLVRSVYMKSQNDGGKLGFYGNSQMIIRFKNTPKSKYFYGPVPRRLRRKRFLSLFASKI